MPRRRNFLAICQEQGQNRLKLPGVCRNVGVGEAGQVLTNLEELAEALGSVDTSDMNSHVLLLAVLRGCFAELTTADSDFVDQYDLGEEIRRQEDSYDTYHLHLNFVQIAGAKLKN